MRVFFTNLGCKLNQAELEDLARQFRRQGYQIVDALDRADLHVVNTCTVTHLAARTSRKIARRGAKVNPGLRTVLTGCYVSAAEQEAVQLHGIDLVVPNDQKDQLLSRIHQALPELRPRATAPAEPLPVPYVPLEFGNARALVKIEDGCDMRCSFCIIPLTRGPQRSRPLAEVVSQVRDLVRSNYEEIVVTGVQISSYRDGERGLFELVEHLLDQTDVARLRLTSIAPWEFDERLLDLVESGRLCRHFHLSLQSGCTHTLRSMRRPYSAEQFAALLERIRSRVEGVAITTDVIVGFPGESEAHFEESLSFVEAMHFTRVHAFPYSSRPGTAAAGLPAQVPAEKKKRRMARMLDVAQRAEAEFKYAHLGEEALVLWEQQRDGIWWGTTDNYLRVQTHSAENLARRLTPVRIETFAG